jgi:hypothetical protein
MNSETASLLIKLFPLLSLRLPSFVVVSDKNGSHRTPGLQTDLMPPEYTFAGEIMGTKNNGEVIVRGNAFACVATSPEQVRERMMRSVYFQKVWTLCSHPAKADQCVDVVLVQGIWDMETVKISALETVHTSNYSQE